MRHRVHDRFSFTRYQLWACWVIQKHGHSRIIRPHYTVQNPTLQSLNDWFYVGSAKIYERVSTAKFNKLIQPKQSVLFTYFS